MNAQGIDTGGVMRRGDGKRARPRWSVRLWRAVGLAVGLLLLPLLALAGDGNFGPHPTTPTFDAGESFDLALGDLDGDGDLDAVVANSSGRAETVWLNDGDGTFAAHPTTPTFGAGSSVDVALGDLDGDGDLDAIVANQFDEAETVWLNSGNGTFTAHPTTPTFGTGASNTVAVGDLDGDGDLDAVVANDSGQAETVWLNSGNGTFTAHPTTPTLGAGSSLDVALGDLDGDGDLDAIVANYFNEAETVWLNSGNGSFTAHPTTPTFGSGFSRDLALGDLDGDGDLDAVVANEFGQAETVWLNSGNGSFTAHPTTPTFGTGYSFELALGDLDGDGDLDAVVANYFEENRAVWPNGGSGSVTAHSTIPTSGAGDSTTVALGDLDGVDDLNTVVANGVDEAETVWLNSGNGSFTAHPTTPTFGAGHSFGLALGDLDGDRDLDAVVANGGAEEETVWLNDGTAAVQLSAFRATAEVDHVRVTWETVSELDNQGFNLYRSASPDEQGERLNAALIPSEAPNSPVGSTYQWIDTDVEAGTSYYYWLEDVDTSGHATRHGPVSVTVQMPSAVTLGTVGASGSSLPHWGWVALGLTALLALLYTRRAHAT